MILTSNTQLIGALGQIMGNNYLKAKNDNFNSYLSPSTTFKGMKANRMMYQCNISSYIPIEE